MADVPESDWTRASSGIYGLTLDELRLIIHLVREWNETRGGYPTATELRVALRRPGA